MTPPPGLRLTLALALSIAACKGKAAPAPSSSPPPPATSDAAPAPPSGKDHETLAREFVKLLADHDYAGAKARYGRDITVDQLQQAWEASVAQGGGTYVGITKVAPIPVPEKDILEVTAQLSGGSLAIDLVFDPGQDPIVGLHIGVDTYQRAPYADPAKFGCHDVNVGTGELALPGTLCLPVGEGPFPLVVLVHGSGPGDRNEGNGKAHPFQDLAEGLATRGVGSLRWDKRTRGHLDALHMKLEDLTIKEEYLDDVHAAIATAQATTSVDPRRVFIVGHSEGGFLAPLLVQANPSVAGAILLSGHARPFASLLPAQARYIAMLDGKLSDAEQLNLAALELLAKHSLDPKLPLDTPASELLPGIGPKGWRMLSAYDPQATVKAIKQPLLILNGERDYQVTVADDLALWKQWTAGRANVETKVYPRLNHLYIAGDGVIRPEEYERGGHVDAQVIEDLAAWIGAQAPAPAPGK